VTPIEELVRQALAETPAVTTTTDPMAALDRRVRRARRWLVAGAGVAAAAVVAAVVVPFAVLDGHGEPNGVGIVNPQPSPTQTPPPGTSVLWNLGAVSVSTDSDGQPWLLFNNGSEQHEYVGRLDEVGRVADPTEVPAPADEILAGDDVIWVIGTETVDGTPSSRVTAIDAATHDVTTDVYDSVSLGSAVTVGDSLYVTARDAEGGGVDRLDLSADAVEIAAAKSMPNAVELVATGDHHVWVHAGEHLVELIPSPRGFDVGETVTWGSGPLVGPGRSVAVWAYDGRLIELSPAMLAAGTSVAEGARVPVPGRPHAALQTRDGVLYVAVDSAGLYAYSSSSVLGDGNTETRSLEGVQVVTMTADLSGGVDYVDDQGRLIHWDPQFAESR